MITLGVLCPLLQRSLNLGFNPLIDLKLSGPPSISVLPADISGQLQRKIENSKKAVTISDNSLKIGPIFTNENKENEHLSKSDEKVPPEISDKVPNAFMDQEVLPEMEKHQKKCTNGPEIIKIYPVMNSPPKISHKKVPRTKTLNGFLTKKEMEKDTIGRTPRHGLLYKWTELLHLTCPHEADVFTLIMSYKLTQNFLDFKIIHF